ncbi:uncharacterized protein [Rutidosis leptorrhynchoides]|uniref:uncharacterized protein isoform X3 n=1 Tax=Rutidosis leptorrhynchoides TaxID=125765 RepID=UPI003A98EA1B
MLKRRKALRLKMLRSQLTYIRCLIWQFATTEKGSLLTLQRRRCGSFGPVKNINTSFSSVRRFDYVWRFAAKWSPYLKDVRCELEHVLVANYVRHNEVFIESRTFDMFVVILF